jgi:hypothetical protein
MPVYPKLAAALKYYEQGQRAPTELFSTPAESNVRIGQFTCQVLLREYPKDHRFFPTLNITSPVGCFLTIPSRYSQNIEDYSYYFSEILGTHFGLEALSKYSIMGFLTPSSARAPNGIVIPPTRALDYALDLTPDVEGGKRDETVPEDEPEVSPNLKDGVWHSVRTGREFRITDSDYPHAIDDAPVLALGNNLVRVLRSSPETESWYEDNPPPQPPKDPQYGPQYVRMLRSYLKKMALQLIERDDWILFWRGYLYTSGAAINFRAIYNGSNAFRSLSINDNSYVAVIDANNQHTLSHIKWGELKTMSGLGYRQAARKNPQGQARVITIFKDIGKELVRTFPKAIFPERYDESLTGELLNAITESSFLNESLTYNQMLTATSQYWATRLKTVRDVHTQPPGLVMLKDGTVDLKFNFESVPSTEGKPHLGYVKFIPERGKANILTKLKGLLGKMGQNIQKFLGKKVPPQVLKGSDLRKMLCEVSCDCKDFKYRMSYANHRMGVTTNLGRTDNGQAPVKTNPAARPGFCKHILATVRYLTDDAELSISKEFTEEQQAALEKDRQQFYRQAQENYKKMPGTPAEEPKDEEPAPAEYSKLPTPPEPPAAAKPAAAAIPQTPITPSYSATQ